MLQGAIDLIPGQHIQLTTNTLLIPCLPITIYYKGSLNKKLSYTYYTDIITEVENPMSNVQAQLFSP